MALARTDLLSDVTAVVEGGVPFVTGSFTPPDNSLLVVVAGVMEESGTTDPSGDLTVSGGGWTFTSRAVIGHTTSWTIGTRIWTAPVTTGVSMTLSLDCAARDIHFWTVGVVAYTGYDTGTPVGATGTFVDTASADGAQTITLSGSPASTSEVIAAMVMDKESTGTTPGAAFGEIYELQYSSSGGLEIESRTGSTSATVDWVDSHTGTGSIFTAAGLAIEIKAAGGAGPTVEGSLFRPLVAPVPRLMRTGVMAPLQLMGDKATPFTATNATVTAVAIATATAVDAPALQTGSTVAATAIATTTGMPVPSFQTGSVVSATAVATTTAMPAPTLLTQTLTFPATIVTTTTLTAPAIQTGSTVVATAIATTTALPAPGLPVIVQPPAVVTTAALPAPAIQAGSTVSATTAVTTTAMEAPIIGTGTILTRTDLHTSSVEPEFGTGPYTTTAFTPPDNSLLVVGGMAIEGAGSGSPCVGDLSISDSETLTWTSRVDESGDDGNLGDYTTGIRIWTAPVITGVSMTVSLNLGARNAGIYALSVVAYTGYATATPIGATGENNQGYAPAGTPQAGSLTLNNPPAASSEVFAAVGVNHTVAGVTHGTGWTEVHDSTGSAWGGLQSQIRGGSTSAAVTWDSLNPSGNLFNYAAVAVEVQAATAGTDATFTPATIATTAALPVPSFQTSQVVTATAIVTVSAVPAIVISGSGSADAYQAGVHIPWMIALPSESSLQLQGDITTPVNPNATVQPPSIATVAALSAPAVQTGSTVAATALATVTALPAPSFQTGSVVSATVLATVTAMPAPSVSAGGGTTVAAISIATVTALPAPVVQQSQTVTGTAIATVTSIAAPAITSFTDATVVATALATVTALPAPTVSAAAQVTATSIATVTALPQPAVVGNVFPGIPGHGRPRTSGGASGNAYPRTSGGIIGRAG